MTTRLKDGLLRLPKEKKLPLKWKTTKNMINESLKERFIRGEVWTFADCDSRYEVIYEV